MPKIIRLDPHVANLIAAGEVVERPASVVKELIENSIDAGARTVTVEIQNGGMTFLRVTDDGCGMVREDAKTAFLRHATAKLRRREDLEAIGTLGFRGEALAATAAVSRVDLLTRVEEELEGTRLHLEAGKILECEDAGCPVGTTIIVRDLFYNTPARMKFMKRDSVEASAVFSAVQKQALAHPEIAFRFLKDGELALQTPGDGQLLSAIYAVLGRQTAAEMIPVESKWENYALSGFVSKPTSSRGTRAYQIFYVNQRLVRSKTLTAALEEAYRNQIMVGRFPSCVLNLTVPLSSVDVNVHPAKTEVKFLNEREIFDCVHYGVKGALNRASGQVPMRFPEQKADKQTQTTLPTQPEPRPASQTVPMQPASGRGAAATKPDFFQHQSAEEFRAAHNGSAAQRAANPKSSAAHCAAQTETDSPRSAAHCAAPSNKPPKPTKPEPLHKLTPVEFEQLAQTLERAPKVAPSRAMREQIFPSTLHSTMQLPAEETAQQTLDLPKAPTFRYLGEVLHTYLIVEQADAVILIDKHAAHERINFERLVAQGTQILGQTLLSPKACRLDREEAAILLQNRALLLSLGFDLDDLGGGDVILRQIPSDLRLSDAEGALSEIAGHLMDGKIDTPESLREASLHTIACKAAIKGGDLTDPVELERLAAQVLSRDDLKYCPHGRPICVVLTQRQLEKQFRRIQ